MHKNIAVLKAINLTKITRHYLRSGYPVLNWPTIDIDVNDVSSETCIASWRWDISSICEVSNNLSECAWDALNLGFSYLLCDIIAIPQDSLDKVKYLISFSKLYEKLHVVIAYNTDPDMRRTWLKNEAIKILNSPTILPYAYHKWKLNIPLIPSLTIRQICTRRLGFHNVNLDKLHLCDSEDAYKLKLKDLDLINHQKLKFTTFNIDRRRQKYSSDILLVYELGSDFPRTKVIEKLSQLKSDSILIPSLIIIWAFVDGLSLSVRGCDWNVNQMVEWVKEILFEVCKNNRFIRCYHNEKGNTIIFEKAIEGELYIEIQKMPYNLEPDYENLFVRYEGQPAKVSKTEVVEDFLLDCIKHIESILLGGIVIEPAPLTKDAPQYDLMFDNYDHYSTDGMN